MRIPNLFLLLFQLLALNLSAQVLDKHLVAHESWANNSVNTVIFRKNSLISNDLFQFIAYYDQKGQVMLGKRKINSQAWELSTSGFKGDANDAHKSISIILDGDGYLHLAWGQHNNALNYAKSLYPNSLVMGTAIQMLGNREQRVSYPEFYQLPDGDLLFLYRDGGSGNGDLLMNRYSRRSKQWSRLQDNLISGEGKRSAYTQTVVDQKGVIHISWVWRESPDVASNHDLAYAKSADGGITWSKSTGEKYSLPITLQSAETIVRIPSNSSLINQTSMAADDQGNPFIASYWCAQGSTVPQYHLVFFKDGFWNVRNLNFRKLSFSLGGGGTKKIPISRPQLILYQKGKNTRVGLIFRDAERGGKASLATNTNSDLSDWTLSDLGLEDLGDWEPSFDTYLWQKRNKLDLYVQRVNQIDGEGRYEGRSSDTFIYSGAAKWLFRR